MSLNDACSLYRLATPFRKTSNIAMSNVCYSELFTIWTNAWDIHNYCGLDCETIKMEQYVEDQLQQARPMKADLKPVREARAWINYFESFM